MHRPFMGWGSVESRGVYRVWVKPNPSPGFWSNQNIAFTFAPRTRLQNVSPLATRDCRAPRLPGHQGPDAHHDFDARGHRPGLDDAAMARWRASKAKASGSGLQRAWSRSVKVHFGHSGVLGNWIFWGVGGFEPFSPFHALTTLWCSPTTSKGFGHLSSAQITWTFGSTVMKVRRGCTTTL